MRLSRRGFSLLELIVVLVLVGVVTAALYRVLIGVQRLSRAQAERTELQQNLRASALILQAELAEAGFDTIPGSGFPSVPDISRMDPTRVRTRALRALGFVCQAGVGFVAVDTSRLWRALRLPVTSPRDSLQLFVENDPGTETDDRWVVRAITSVSGTTCPVTGSAALRYVVSGSTSGVTAGSPARVFEVMDYRIGLSADGRYYLEARSRSSGGTYQPALGPLTDTGLQFEYLDEQGNAAWSTAMIRAVRVRIAAQSANPVQATASATPQFVAESLVSETSLRNAIRP